MTRQLVEFLEGSEQLLNVAESREREERVVLFRGIGGVLKHL